MVFNIRCDMEGLTGVTSYAQVDPASDRYREGRRLLMNDLNAVIAGIMRADGDAEIIIFDEHMDGRNVDVLDLQGNAVYISGKPAYTESDAGAIAGADGMLLVGFHSKAGTPSATLPHTYEHDIVDMEVNGESIGEVGVEAIIAGDAGVPTLFYSGDSAGRSELEDLSPNTLCVSVKESISEGAAMCLAGAKSYEMLRASAQESVARRSRIAPVTVAGPVALRVCLKDNAFSESLRKVRPQIFEHINCVMIEAATLTGAFAEYWKWKLEAQDLLV